MVDQAVAAGAKVIGDHRGADGTGWVTLTDPEGNEFCIERGVAERGAPEPRSFRIGT
jgi:predicted enzyme related to lactoylglutathione lyase